MPGGASSRTCPPDLKRCGGWQRRGWEALEPKMKQADARTMVLRLFREWAEVNGKVIPHTEPEGGLVFYCWLEKHHPEALRFRDVGDRWQTVHIWLLKTRLVTQ